MTEPFFSIRPAENTVEDRTLLAQFMGELAAFDGYQATANEEKLKENLFYPGTNIRAFLAFRKSEPVGFILFYESFTVYHGERGLYVPGAYIVPQYRHKGYGVKLFEHVAAYALENSFVFMNWLVEEGNEKANRIYAKMGAQISKGWSYVRVPKETMEKARALTKRNKKA